MKNRKKLIGILLATVMTASVFLMAGCGNQDSQNATQQSAETEATADLSEAAAETVEKQTIEITDQVDRTVEVTYPVEVFSSTYVGGVVSIIPRPTFWRIQVGLQRLSDVGTISDHGVRS